MQRAPAGARSAESPPGEGPSTPAPAPAAGWFSQGLSMFSPTAPIPPPPSPLEARLAPPRPTTERPKQGRTQAEAYYLREEEKGPLAKHGKLEKRKHKDKLKKRSPATSRVVLTTLSTPSWTTPGPPSVAGLTTGWCTWCVPRLEVSP